MNKEDIKLLKFIYERLSSVYGESKNIDFMINFGILLGKLTEDITDSIPAPPAKPPKKDTIKVELKTDSCDLQGVVTKGIPNCCTCDWNFTQIWPDGSYKIICCAQGYANCPDVWNTDECKQLYEVSE